LLFQQLNELFGHWLRKLFRLLLNDPLYLTHPLTFNLVMYSAEIEYGTNSTFLKYQKSDLEVIDQTWLAKPH